MYFYKAKIRKGKEAGFTLIELLVVISIISLLATIIFGALGDTRVKSRDTRRLSDMNSMRLALELAYDRDGTYPISRWICSSDSAWESSPLAIALEPNLSTLPVDPVNTGNSFLAGNNSYCYYSNGYGGSGRWYMLIYQLESQNSNLDASDGVTTCNDTVFDYGGNDGYIITAGVSCI